MLIQILPPLIMFAITVIFASLFMTPAFVIRQKNKLVNFYWVGFWLFLVAITSIAGGQSTLLLAGIESQTVSQVILSGIMAAFIGFVFFGWFRLAGHAALSFLGFKS